MNKYIIIKELKTDKIIREIDVSNETEASIYKIDIGLNINLNSDKYYTDIIEK